MKHSELSKCRTLVLPDTAAVHAATALLQAAGYHCLPLPALRRLMLSYTLPQQTLADALALLPAHQLAAPGSLQHWHLKLLLFSESVQLSNLVTPVADSKGRHAFSQIYQQHPHGDHDDTPEELRHER